VVSLVHPVSDGGARALFFFFLSFFPFSSHTDRPTDRCFSPQPPIPHFPQLPFCPSLSHLSHPYTLTPSHLHTLTNTNNLDTPLFDFGSGVSEEGSSHPPLPFHLTPVGPALIFHAPGSILPYPDSSGCPCHPSTINRQSAGRCHFQ